MEKPIHLEDVGVVGVKLDLYLLNQLALHPGRLHLRFGNHLNRTAETSHDLPAHIHIPELPSTQLPAHLEHAQTQLFSLSGRQNAAEVQQ